MNATQRTGLRLRQTMLLLWLVAAAVVAGTTGTHAGYSDAVMVQDNWIDADGGFEFPEGSDGPPLPPTPPGPPGPGGVDT